MSKYAFAYHGGPGMASTEEEMAEAMAACQPWFIVMALRPLLLWAPAPCLSGL